MFDLLLKSSSGASLKSSSGAFPIVSAIGLVFTQASVAVIRSGYLATQAVQKAMPLARALLPTSTTPLVASKTVPAVDSAGSTKLSIVLASFLVLGISMGSFALFSTRRVGSSGCSPGNSPSAQGPPLQFPDEDPSSRAPSSAGGPPPPPPDLETETIPEPRGRSRFPWMKLLVLVIFLIVSLFIARYFWRHWVKPSITWCAKSIGAWVGKWTCVIIGSVLCIAFVEVLLPGFLWVASKIKNFYFRWLVTMKSLRLRAKTQVKLATFTIFIIAQVAIIGALCRWLGSLDWLDITCFILTHLTRNAYLEPCINVICVTVIFIYFIGEICFSSLTPTRTIFLIAPAVIVRLLSYMRTLKSQRDAALSGQIAELRRGNENFGAQLSAITPTDEPNHNVPDAPVAGYSDRPKKSRSSTGSFRGKM